MVEILLSRGMMIIGDYNINKEIRNRFMNISAFVSPLKGFVSFKIVSISSIFRLYMSRIITSSFYILDLD